MEKRIAQASRAFGALRKAVFSDNNLKLETKRKIYQACILPVLLYGSECWIPLRKHIRKLNTFYHRFIRTILGMSYREQWAQHISMAEVRRWGDNETAAIKVTKCRLEWLGHLARLPDHRIPKSTLLGWLPQPHPSDGPRRRWRDVIRKDLKTIELDESKWYEEATASRAGWRATCRLGLGSSIEERAADQLSVGTCEVTYDVCSRKFRRESDKKRPKCRSQREKPVREQRGATQCKVCRRWYLSRGGLAVHTCRPGA